MPARRGICWRGRRGRFRRWVDKRRLFSICSHILLVEGRHPDSAVGKKQERRLRVRLAGRTLGAPRTPPYGHYDPCAGSLLDYRVKALVTRVGKRGPRCVRLGLTKTPWWSAERRGVPIARDLEHAPQACSGPLATALRGLANPCAFRRSAPLLRRRANKKKLRKSRAHPAAATSNRARGIALCRFTICSHR